MAEALAIDLFIQVLEQFNTLKPDRNPEFVRVFGLYWQQYIPNFKRTIDVSLARYRKEEAQAKKEEAVALERASQREVNPHTQAKEPGVFVGVSADISKWWQVWDRPVVRYTSLSPDMRAFLRDILSVKGDNNEKETGRCAVAQGLGIGKTPGI
ncbi:MAG: hypothetical protein M5U34_27905 [Chloroflexi bacterium]|nr:hypothetical protein [Chloroflexota bacterium]